MPKGGMARLRIYIVRSASFIINSLFDTRTDQSSVIIAARMYDPSGMEYCQNMGTLDNWHDACPTPYGEEHRVGCELASYDYIPESGERIVSFNDLKDDANHCPEEFTKNHMSSGNHQYIAIQTSSGRKVSRQRAH